MTRCVTRCLTRFDLRVTGGDGTVMWVVSEAQKHGIHTETSLRIGMVPLGTGHGQTWPNMARHGKWPFGEAHGTTIFAKLCREQVEQVLKTSILTGNDFAQALGWGGRTDMIRYGPYQESMCTL